MPQLLLLAGARVGELGTGGSGARLAPSSKVLRQALEHANAVRVLLESKASANQ